MSTRNKISVPLAVAGAVVAVVAVLGAIFVFSDTDGEAGSGSGQPAGQAPTTQLTLSNPQQNPSGTESKPDTSFPPVPAEQVDGILVPVARTAGRNLYIPVQDDDACTRDQVWPRGEHADRVEVEIRTFPITPPSGITTDANGNGSLGCLGRVHSDGPYAVIELAEPLGDRRLVVTYVSVAPPR